MNRKSSILALLSAMLLLRVQAQNYDTNGAFVQTFAGSGFSGYLDGQGMQTMFNGPAAIAADLSNNLFVFDYYNLRVRKITPSGAVSTFAGGGSDPLPGYGTNISLSPVVSMTIDHSNTLYLLNYTFGMSMLRIGSDGYVSNISLSGFPGGGGHSGICVDSGNNLYISNVNDNRIYRYQTNGALQVFAGSGNPGSADGNGVFTSFSGPSALAADTADNIYVWDSGNNLIRRINQNGDVVTIAGRKNPISESDGVGTNATFNIVSAICSDGSGNIYLACYSSTGGESIRKMDATTNVTTLAGSFTQSGYTNGPGSLARFNGSGNEGICFTPGMIFLADFGNQRIRNITFNPSSEPVLPANLQLNTYPGLQITGTVGRTYQIETSPDMTNWTLHATLLLNSSPYLWIDQNQVSGSKFYRAWLLP